jgi:hypothetical protein
MMPGDGPKEGMSREEVRRQLSAHLEEKADDLALSLLLNWNTEHALHLQQIIQSAEKIHLLLETAYLLYPGDDD